MRQNNTIGNFKISNVRQRSSTNSMKTKQSLILWGAIVCSQSHAQWVVTDPQVLFQTLHNGRVAVDQLTTTRDVKTYMGNPAAIHSVAGLDPLLGHLGRAPTERASASIWKEARDRIEKAITGKAGISFGGLYKRLGERIELPDGKQLLRSVESYKPFEAVFQAAEQADSALGDIQRRRQKLLEAVADTAQQIASATTQAEVMKLQGVATAQSAALSALGKEQDEAAARVQLREIQNRNDQARQDLARIEERVAEFGFAQREMNRLLQLKTAPVGLPVRP